MDFRILGPLQAIDDSGPVNLAGGKQQALLALLLLNADRVVSMDRLVDDLWGDDVPETAPKMVQILVSQLRKRLPDGLLRTRPPGYLVDMDGHTLDLRRFDELVEEGREMLEQGRAESAAVHFQNALALWRGPALQEFQEPFARVESSRLEEQRLACLEERIEADLALARHAELVGELDTLVRRHPHRERLRGQLMLALYRSGRHAEALESYRDFRQLLADGVGIDPPARLRELERRMLQQDSALDIVARPHPAADRAPGAPAGVDTCGEIGAPHGRERELAHLTRLLEEAHAGERRLVFLTGEAGIGKTTIVESLIARADAAAQTFVAQGQCVAHHGAGEAYLPVLDAFGRLTRRPNGRRFVPQLARQAPTWIAQMPGLLTDDELESVQRRLLGATHLRMLREMVETLEAITQEITLVLLLEDLHWSDFSTVDLLDAIARRSERARLLVLGTYRQGDAVAREHPIHRLGRELRPRGLCTEIAVGPLSGTAVEQYVRATVGADTGPGVAAVLEERTGGNPLFVTTLLGSWLEQDLLGGGEPDVARLAGDVPDSVRELIAQMLEQLGPTDGELLSAASVVGQEFSAAAAAAASGLSTEEVDARCDALSRAGRFVERSGEERWPDDTLSTRYRFAHELHREVLYGRLTAGRRAQTHARIGERLEAAYLTRPREIAATLAEHFALAGDDDRAVVALRLAAEQAFERLAHPEAVEHLTTALAMLERLSNGPERSSEELALQSMLGAALVAAHGWSSPEAEVAFLRSHELAEGLGRGDELGLALFRLSTLYEVRGEYERSETLLEQTLALSGPSAGSGLVTDSHELLACSLFHQGAFDEALEHAERGLASYDGRYLNPVRAAYGINAGAQCLSWAALSLWFLGYPDLARTRAGEAVALASDPLRRHGYATALTQAAIVEQCRLDAGATRRNAEAAVEAATRDGYPYRIAMGRILRGWALAAEGAHDEGIAELGHGLTLSGNTGAHMDDPYYFALLADACIRAGRLDAASDAVEAGLGHAPPGRRFFFESELHRLAGELLLRLGRREDAEARLQHALELARRRSSPSLELRATLSLAGHLHAGGQGDQARELTAGVYSGFTEGFATHDLTAARALLEQLGS